MSHNDETIKPMRAEFPMTSKTERVVGRLTLAGLSGMLVFGVLTSKPVDPQQLALKRDMIACKAKPKAYRPEGGCAVLVVPRQEF